MHARASSDGQGTLCGKGSVCFVHFDQHSLKLHHSLMQQIKRKMMVECPAYLQGLDGEQLRSDLVHICSKVLK